MYKPKLGREVSDFQVNTMHHEALEYRGHTLSVRAMGGLVSKRPDMWRDLLEGRPHMCVSLDTVGRKPTLPSFGLWTRLTGNE